MYEATMSIMLLLMFILFIMASLYAGLKTVKSAKNLGDASVAKSSLNTISEAITNTFTRTTISLQNKQATSEVSTSVIPGMYLIGCYKGKVMLMFIPSKSDNDASAVLFPLLPKYDITLNVKKDNNKVEPQTFEYKVRVNGVELERVCGSGSSEGISIPIRTFTESKQVVVEVTVTRTDPYPPMTNTGYFDVNIVMRG